MTRYDPGMSALLTRPDTVPETHDDGTGHVYLEESAINAKPVLPGFSMKVADLFPKTALVA
jgi:hypothetical protein